MVLHVSFRMAGLIVGGNCSKTHIPEIKITTSPQRNASKGETVLSETGALHVTGPTDMILPRPS